MMKPLPPVSVAAIAGAALIVGAWIGSSGVLSRKPANLDRAAVEAIVLETIAKHPEAVQGVVKDYIVKSPDLVKQALAEMMRAASGGQAAAAAPRPAPPAPDRSAAINSNAKDIFNSPRGVTLGNPKGDVTLVEFFDYNCGFCKRALADKIALMKSDPNLKVVLKEYPVLGQGSVEAARVAVAVRMQDTDGTRYAKFHEVMLGSPQRADKARALAVAAELGFDPSRIEADMAGPEATATIEESARLARALGINGTPSYVVGSQVVIGAVGQAALTDRIKQARR